MSSNIFYRFIIIIIFICFINFFSLVKISDFGSEQLSFEKEDVEQILDFEIKGSTNVDLVGDEYLESSIRNKFLKENIFIEYQDYNNVYVSFFDSNNILIASYQLIKNSNSFDIIELF